MKYDELSIHARINMKAALQAWLKYSVQHFRAELDQKVYGLRTSRKGGVQRSSLGKAYKFGSGRSRTNALRRAWDQSLTVAGGVDRVMISFLLYGRFLDMGVGKGTTHTGRIVSRMLREGSSGRTRRAWYSKRKTYEIKRLREVLAQMHVRVPVDALETALQIGSINLTV